MSGDGRDLSETGADPKGKRSDARIPRTIRFSEPEWERVENAAKHRGIAAAEFARNAALDAAEGKSSALSGEIVEMIQRIYRSTYIISTLKRDEMLREGRGDELEKMISAARESQALLLKKALE